MSNHKERFADKMEFPPATEQPNIYPLSWNVKTKKLQEVWEASLRENWDPEKLPWDTLDVDSYTWEEREAIAYCESVADYVSRQLFVDILDSEEEHIDWLETQLSVIDRIGEPNYLLTKLDD